MTARKSDPGGARAVGPAVVDEPGAAPARERVSVLIPTLNEEASIDRCLRLLDTQSCHPHEVIVADGGSTDRTRELVTGHGGGVRLIDNPHRLQSAGLNLAFKASSGDVIVRLDARSFIHADYLEKCLALLESTGAAVVGGRMVPQPQEGTVAAGIAAANTAGWGAGPARFHTGGAAGPAETVYLGCFRREWLDRVGGWAEDVGVNEDYELNHRIRQQGGVVWLDPSIEVGYQPRTTLSGLVTQYFRYGRSKATVMRRHPASIRMRQLTPLALPVCVGFAALGPRDLRGIARGAMAAHVGLVLAGAASLRGRSPSVRALAAASALLMHWSWAIGVAYGAFRPFPPAQSSS